MKALIKKFIPSPVILLYHYCLAAAASLFYRFPSKKMIVIGVTGTKGKTSACNFIWSVLTAGGLKTGIVTTTNIKIGDEGVLNKYHMTMPGRLELQRLLNKMVRSGCQYAVVETTSEGIKQYRHVGIHYDMAVFTNLSPEHLTSHGGSFEKYKKTKGILFSSLGRSGKKKISGKEIGKTAIINNDDENKDYFLNFPADKKLTFGLESGSDFQAKEAESNGFKTSFLLEGRRFQVNFPGSFNILNALPAIIIGRLEELPDDIIDKGLQNLKSIPGRIEIIDEGQNFTVIVDYAHEKVSIGNILDVARSLAGNNKVIILTGSAGGGRDRSRGVNIGEVVGEKADCVIVSNEDPYFDDPEEICETIAKSAESKGKIRNQNLFVVLDRKLGICKALSFAEEGDVVIIAGKGAEQSIIIKDKKIPWDDRQAAREEIKNLIRQ